MGNKDIEFLLQEAFLGYKYRKENKKLYNNDIDLPVKLIYMYYANDQDRNFEDIPKAFVNRYIKNECLLEGVHDQLEIKGQGIMYDFAHTTDEIFDIYSLISFHKQLYACTPFPECGGSFRNSDAYLAGKPVNLLPWYMIRGAIRELDPVVNELIQRSKTVNKKKNDELFKYIDDCIKLKCLLIKIHPFFDGNGRTVRCFVNCLFEMAGIPPTYIKVSEREEYHSAMEKAICDNDYNSILNFYYYKICDSIIELDINERIKKQKQKVKKVD